MKDILILSRQKVEELSKHSEEVLSTARKELGPIAVISITCPGDETVCIPHITEFILRLEFDDISTKQDGMRSGQQKLKMVNSDDANKVAAFINRVADKINLLIVHCDAGISRSAGVGIAIAEETGLDEVAKSLLQTHPHYNRDVYRIIKEGFHAESV